MNQQDRDRMARLYALIDRVPFPHAGSGGPTASLRGMVTYQEDMRVFMPMLKTVVLAIARPDMEAPDQELAEIEHLIRRREVSGWS
ncbi:hypothetical protein LCGC14_3058970 [marine sediment metagenome]|uniref:Uncharacterized protein n=1 Tax=marine sediment metagenome TaxID=412755 RepID=A0A0F8WK15_9ZZZZ